MDDIEFDSMKEIALHKYLIEKIANNNSDYDDTVTLTIVFSNSLFGLDTYNANLSRVVDVTLINPDEI